MKPVKQWFSFILYKFPLGLSGSQSRRTEQGQNIRHESFEKGTPCIKSCGAVLIAESLSFTTYIVEKLTLRVKISLKTT